MGDPMPGVCGHRFAAMDIDGWGYVECTLPKNHVTDAAKRGGGHRPDSPIVHDGGAYRMANLPDFDDRRTVES
jgi:hypothetical protein